MTTTASDAVGVDDAEEDAPRSPAASLMPAMPAGRAPLRAHRAAAKRSSWASRRDEDELGVVGRRRGADDAVAVLQRDDLEVVLGAELAAARPA